MLAPEDFFDLSEFEHRDLFTGLEFAWQAIPRIQLYLAAQLHPERCGTVQAGAFIEGAVFLGEGSVVEAGATILGPAIIGRESVVRQGAYIRGSVIIGDRCHVGHATEAKNAVLLNGAKAAHFAYVGDSILGAEVNLGAGTKLSNLKTLGGEVIVRVEGRDYATGLRKFGAILGDYAETGCNAVLNPGTLVGRGSIIYPCISARGYVPPHSVMKLRQETEIVPRR